MGTFMSGSNHPAVDYEEVTSRRSVDEPTEHVNDAGRKAVAGSDRVSISASQPRHEQRNSQWAIAPIGNMGAGAAYGVELATFELVNRATDLAHWLHFGGRGFDSSPFPFGGNTSVGRTKYAQFTTSRPVNFADFDGLKARLTSGGTIRSVSYLTLWEGRAYRSPQLAYVRMSGWDIGDPFPSVMQGETEVELVSGEPSGLVRRVIELEPHRPERPPPPLNIRNPAMERPLLDIPSDILFDFDSAELQSGADEQLRLVGDLLNRRQRLPVDIEGHTDSIGSPEYNRELSRRRAETVKQWFIEENVYGAEDFRIRPRGETEPLARNTRPDGSDNPEGRQKNRRVTVVAVWNI